MEKTKVIFVKVDDHVDALFPEIKEGKMYILGYAHIGQHSTYHKSWLNEKRATPVEYEDLKNELQNLVGYNLEVV